MRGIAHGGHSLRHNEINDLHYFDDHEDLESKVQILENKGMVRDVTNKNVKRYRMAEALVDYLTGGPG
jgi:hypothetical protein